MAGGKMSARQKMINLMYLVFIAMLALNMSKEVLSAFGFMNEKLTENNISTTEKNNQAYANLAMKANDQAVKFEALNKQAIQIKNYSAEFYTYLEVLKSKMTADIEDKEDYEAMDQTSFLDEYFFKGDKFTDEGLQFLNKINGFRSDLTEVLGVDNQFASLLMKRFSTEDEINRDGKTIKWLDYRFKGFPLVASLTNLTQMQADIKNTEADIISNLLGGRLESEVSMSNYNGVVQLDKNAFYPGDKVTGSVVLGRYDPSLKPNRVELNGKKYENFKDGSVILDLRAGSVGEKDIKGTIYFMEKGVEIPVPFKSSYSVISKPNSPVVSADKMNVVYRGLENPISISLPGVPDKDITASAPGLKKTGSGKYLMTPSAAGSEVNISVKAKLADGNTRTTNTVFRVKDIPAAMGTIREQYGTVRMPKSGLSNTPIGAGLPDFLFDLDLLVTSFKVKVPGELAIIVKGTRFNAAAKKALSKARRGDIITIYDIKAGIRNNSYKLKRVIPVSIELTN
jgi:gliding motility-associated protein GldM